MVNPIHGTGCIHEYIHLREEIRSTQPFNMYEMEGRVRFTRDTIDGTRYTQEMSYEMLIHTLKNIEVKKVIKQIRKQLCLEDTNY